MTANSLPVVRTKTLGGSALSKAARAGQLPQWFSTIPVDGPAWAAHARDVIASVPADWSESLREAMAPTGKAAERLAKSAGGKGIVVTTGQQPGLFGGPLMSLVKAISARALADALQAQLGIPVAPVFWAATDDADFDEAAVVSVAVDGGARELRLDERAPAGTPMSRVPIGHDVEALASLLRDASGSAPHASYLDAAFRAYRDGATVGDAYVELLRQILEPLEIAVLDASHPAVAHAAQPLLSRAVTSAAAVAAAVRQRSGEIEAAGFAPQVVEVPGLSLVFLNTGGVKRRLSLADADSLTELEDRQFLSSTVLLRPVMERALLPTAAYVGGPGEFAYFGQVTAVAHALASPIPLVVPRWSMSLIEPRIQRVLDDLGIEAESLSDPHAVEGRVARERTPEAMQEALRTLRADVARDVDALNQANAGLVSVDVLDGLRRSLDHKLQRMERRVTAAVKRRETRVMRQVATARGSLYPHGAPQERKLGYVPFLARYGPDLLDRMLAEAGAHARAIVGQPADGTLAPAWEPART
jgi:bacillithiol biosynthesis cysteine-adding enzyme BshC